MKGLGLADMDPIPPELDGIAPHCRPMFFPLTSGPPTPRLYCAVQGKEKGMQAHLGDGQACQAHRAGSLAALHLAEGPRKFWSQVQTSFFFFQNPFLWDFDLALTEESAITPVAHSSSDLSPMDSPAPGTKGP